MVCPGRLSPPLSVLETGRTPKASTTQPGFTRDPSQSAVLVTKRARMSILRLETGDWRAENACTAGGATSDLDRLGV
jgi:hypothetical protein